MKLLLLLLFGWIWSKTDAQAQTFLVVAPLTFRLDALEKVVLQVFGFSDPVTVHVSLRKTMAVDHIRQERVTLSATNQHMGEVQLRLFPSDVDNDMNHVILHVQSQAFQHHMSLPLSRTNGFMVVQTDKPLYTPRQSVKVRAFSLNQELRPADRSVFLTFRDPDYEKVAVVEVKDVSNGMPSLQNPFKIPLNPKLGIWTLEASYMEHFDTKASTTFEVREYVLPSFTIMIEPMHSYVSHNNFRAFRFKVSAKYLHGAPVAGAETFLRYGFLDQTSSPVIIPNSITRQQLTSSGELEVNVDLEQIFSRHNGLKTLSELTNKFLYITVLLQEESGGVSEEAELQSVKFVQSPYTLDLVSTPPFIKPGLPYNMQVLVKDHQGEPVSSVPVRLVDKRLHKRNGETEELFCSPDTSNSHNEGIAIFTCNINTDALSIDLQVVTDDRSLPAQSQASLPLMAESYESPNGRYLYIDPSPIQTAVGAYTQVTVYSVAPPYARVKSLNYLIMSKGKVVKFGWIPLTEKVGNRHTLSFQVTAEMAPSIRLLVYYMPYGESTTELVADAVWLNIRADCVNELQTELKTQGTEFKPQQQLQMDVTVNQDGYIAMAAVDTGIYSLRPKYKDPVDKVLNHFESADQGCGGGGGKNAADVFRLAGLSFMTNANSGHSPVSGICTSHVRPKRAIHEEKKKKILSQYRSHYVRECCRRGMDYSPSYQTCEQYTENVLYKHGVRCREAFKDCCIFMQKNINSENNLGRAEMGADFGKVQTLARSHFPESWLWQVRRISRGTLRLTEVLPHSLTTWHIKTVGMFDNGMCVAKAATVSVNQPLSVNIPLPYQIIRGEQVQLRGSVYNHQLEPIRFCVTLSVGPELCAAESAAAEDGSTQRSTACNDRTLPGESVGEVRFTVMALEAGEHQLRFTLLTAPAMDRFKPRLRPQDVLVKTLAVVPEGKLQVEMVGGRLDPQGVYGPSKTVVALESALPQNIVPNTEVQRVLSINGEILDQWVSVVDNPEGLKKLLSLHEGTAASEIGGLLPILYVYQYLETTGRWNTLGQNDNRTPPHLKELIRQGLSGVSMYKRKDFSYSMFMNQNTSTWVTALTVQTLAMVNDVLPVDLDSLTKSVNWLINNAQRPDGSFQDVSFYKPNKIMALPNDNVEKSVYFTSFVIIALHKATAIPAMTTLKLQDDSIQAAMAFLSRNIVAVNKVYVLAVAAYALTLHNPNSMVTIQLLDRLEGLAKQRGNPPDVRYWQEPEVQKEWLKPDESSAQTVETTAYALLSFLLKGRFPYSTPIVTWLTQDQHYGGGYFSLQDTLMTLEAVTLYYQRSLIAELDQNILIRVNRQSDLNQEVHLYKRSPVVAPIQISKNSAVTAKTAFGTGVSSVTLKTVYYQTVPPQKNCFFDITLELLKYGSRDNGLNAPHLIACAKYKPPPNELVEESLLTVMEIQLPTGVEAFVDDLQPLTQWEFPVVASYRLSGRTVLINIYAVPTDRFLCVGFRTRTSFVVGGTSDVIFTVYEEQDKGSKCTKMVSDQEQKVHRLCQYDQCQCVTGVCVLFRGTVSAATVTVDKLRQEVCRPHIKYAYKVKVTKTGSEGDFTTLTAVVQEVIKGHSDFDTVSGGTEVDFIKKTTCSSADIQNNQQYLIFGSSGLEVGHNQNYRFQFPLDSDAVVQIWPTDCGSDCAALVTFSFLAQLESC